MKLRQGVTYTTIIGPPADTLTFERHHGRVRNRRINGRRVSAEVFAEAVRAARVG